MYDSSILKLVVAGAPATHRRRGRAATTQVVELPAGVQAALAELPHEDPREEPYRPELVRRLERAVRAGSYRPDPYAIADALVRTLDVLT